MSEQSEDLFDWENQKTQETLVDFVEEEKDPVNKDDKLEYDCIQCEIGGGTCPRHPRDIDDLIIHIPHKSISSEKPLMDDEENDGGVRIAEIAAAQAELEKELSLDQPMSPEDIEKYFGGFEKKADIKKPLDSEGV